MSYLLLILLCGIRFVSADVSCASTTVLGWGDSNTEFGYSSDPSIDASWLGWLNRTENKWRTYYNSGVSGDTVTEMIARFNTDVSPFVGNGDFVVVWGGLNDDVGGASVDTIYRRIQVACSLATTTGAKVLVSTYCMTGGNMYEVNDSLIANWATFADGLVNDTADSLIGETANHANTTWFANEYHYTSVGYRRKAELYIAPTIRGLE